MPVIDFTFKPISKRQRQKMDRDEIVYKDVVGSVWVNKSSDYFVLIDNAHSYPVHKDCYSTKGKRVIYRKGFNFKNRVLYIRLLEDSKIDLKDWQSFDVGVVVVGNIIRHKNGCFSFYIKRVSEDYTNIDAHNALEYYKQNRKEIKYNYELKKIREKTNR